MEVAHADRVSISEGHPGDLGQGPGPDAGHRCQAAHDLGGIAVLLVWPLLDSVVGPRLARRLGWRSWPTPRHNPITGALWVVGFVVVVALTLWGLARPGLCLPWFYQGPVCG